MDVTTLIPEILEGRQTIGNHYVQDNRGEHILGMDYHLLFFSGSPELNDSKSRQNQEFSNLMTTIPNLYLATCPSLPYNPPLYFPPAEISQQPILSCIYKWEVFFASFSHKNILACYRPYIFLLPLHCCISSMLSTTPLHGVGPPQTWYISLHNVDKNLKQVYLFYFFSSCSLQILRLVVIMAC